MIITATINRKFKVSDEWMKACGLSAFSSTFEVNRIDDIAPGLVMVELKSHIIGHDGKWVVNAARGEFI